MLEKKFEMLSVFSFFGGFCVLKFAFLRFAVQDREEESLGRKSGL